LTDVRLQRRLGAIRASDKSGVADLIPA
jgi:hypothetical protein